MYENIKKYVEERKLHKAETAEAVTKAVQGKLTKPKLAFLVYIKSFLKYLQV